MAPCQELADGGSREVRLKARSSALDPKGGAPASRRRKRNDPRAKRGPAPEGRRRQWSAERRPFADRKAEGARLASVPGGLASRPGGLASLRVFRRSAPLGLRGTKKTRRNRRAETTAYPGPVKNTGDGARPDAGFARGLFDNFIGDKKGCLCVPQGGRQTRFTSPRCAGRGKVKERARRAGRYSLKPSPPAAAQSSPAAQSARPHWAHKARACR